MKGKKKLIPLLTVVLLFTSVSLFTCKNTRPEKTYKPTWQSLSSHPVPQWYQDAIYGTTTWTVYGEGPTRKEVGSWGREKGEYRFKAGDVRFTRKGNTLYAIALTWPEKPLNIEAFGELDEAQIESLSLLGSDEKIDWSVFSSGMTIQPPEEKPCKHAFAFKVRLK
jgi:alpha-L-fucosidase